MLSESVEKISKHSFSNYSKEQVVLQQMVWSPQGPDLNIIEAVWEKRQPKSVLKKKKKPGRFSKMLKTT